MIKIELVQQIMAMLPLFKVKDDQVVCSKCELVECEHIDHYKNLAKLLEEALNAGNKTE